MGIKILKPVIYLGNKPLELNKIIKKKYDYKNKIGSSRINIEEYKSVFEMALEVGKKALKNTKQRPKFLIFVSYLYKFTSRYYKNTHFYSYILLSFLKCVTIKEKIS